jgi:hypothetical protein
MHNPAEKTIVSAQIAAEQRLELQRLAVRGDRTLSAEVRRAVTSHLASQHCDDGASHHPVNQALRRTT